MPLVTTTAETFAMLDNRSLWQMTVSCEANVRRTYKDFADVVELIDVRGLDGSFVRMLYRNVRETFRRSVRNAWGEV